MLTSSQPKRSSSFSSSLIHFLILLLLLILIPFAITCFFCEGDKCPQPEWRRLHHGSTYLPDNHQDHYNDEDQLIMMIIMTNLPWWSWWLDYLHGYDQQDDYYYQCDHHSHNYNEIPRLGFLNPSLMVFDWWRTTCFSPKSPYISSDWNKSSPSHTVLQNYISIRFTNLYHIDFPFDTFISI